MSFWNVSEREALRHLETSAERGLNSQEAKARLQKFGPNEFEKEQAESIVHMVLRQFKEISNLVLLVAVSLSFALAIKEGHGFLEPAVIFIIILINVILAVTQERGAEKALDALQNLNSPTSQVLRDGAPQVLDSKELVPGDIVILKTGDLIAADVRLIEAVGLSVDESALTGESEPVEKDADQVLDEDTSIGDRTNMAHAGCLVTAGNARGVVVATGMESEMGKIASFLNNAQTLQTPLQRRLIRVTKMVSLIAGVAAIILLITGLQQGEDLWQMILAAVSLAVAAVPETLQLIVTLTLTQGIHNMVDKHALIRRLPAVETLGSTSVICSDKTGTLTQNRMSVRRLWTPGSEVVRVNDEGDITYLKDGADSDVNLAREAVHYEDFLQKLIKVSTATFDMQEDGSPHILGDATESALLRLALLRDMDIEAVRGELVKVAEIPFSSSRKMMSVIYELPSSGYLVLTKGAFDRLPFADSKEDDLKERQKVHDSFAQDALRVIALGSRLVAELPASDKLEELESNLRFEGIVGIIDPPRKEAAEAIALAKKAGVRTVMITGDHAETAAAIARNIGLLGTHDKVVTGKDLADMSDEELIANVRSYSVYARVSPEDKIRIVEAWQEQGEVVAMTGDGVNDAPALKTADVGVAMGKAGTEVAKASADMVLTDDNFATIVEAVREGRNVFSNIKRTIYFLLACNLSEIVVMLFSQLAGWGIPLTPVMLLLVNVMGDGIPGLNLAKDTSDELIMKRKPIGRTESFFAGGLMRTIILQTLAFSVVGVLSFWIGMNILLPGHSAPSFAIGQTMCFFVMALTSVLHVFTVRSRRSVFQRAVTDNMGLVWASLAMFLTFSAIVLIEPLAIIFGMTQLSIASWAVAFVLAVLPTFFAELIKAWDAHREQVLYRLRLVRHINRGLD